MAPPGIGGAFEIDLPFVILIFVSLFLAERMRNTVGVSFFLCFSFLLPNRYSQLVNGTKWGEMCILKMPNTIGKSISKVRHHLPVEILIFKRLFFWRAVCRLE